LAAAGKGTRGTSTGLSPYSGGDPLKMIHWRLSARHDELKVKELSATAREPLVIDIDRLAGAELGRKALLCHLSCEPAHAGRETGGGQDAQDVLSSRPIPGVTGCGS